MPELSPTARAYGWAAGVINSAAQAHASTSEVWSAVRGEAERLGITDLTGAFQAVNEIRGLYVAQRVAGEQFARTDDGALMTRSLAPMDINARDLADQSLFPEYMARFTLWSVDDEGELHARQVTYKDRWTPDMTVGDVRDNITEAAAGMATKYGVDLDHVSNIEVVSV